MPLEESLFQGCGCCGVSAPCKMPGDGCCGCFKFVLCLRVIHGASVKGSSLFEPLQNII